MAADTIVRVDPSTLLVGANVRKDTKLTKEFVASIKELGVRIPITAYESGEGLVVIDGQRRTLAAVDAGVTEVPVFVTSAPSEQDRLVDQVVVNEQRSELDQAEAVAAVQQLALFDLKAPAIAKKLGLQKQFVEDAVAVGASEAARAVYERHGSLETAVDVAATEGMPEQAALLELKSSWEVREQARALAKKAKVDAFRAELEAAGVTVVKEPGYYDVDPQPVQHLYRDEKCKDGLDGLPHEEVAAIAGEGLVAWVVWRWDGDRQEPKAQYGIRGWQERGLHVQGFRLANAKSAKPSTPEEVEAAKVQRRQARENTKAWVAASAERMVWLQQLVQRRTMPKGWEPVVAARMLNSQGFSTSQLRGIIAVLQLTEGDEYSLRGVIEKHLRANPTKAMQIMLAIELGAVEGLSDFGKKGWDGAAWGFDLAATQAYLKRLAEWGYELSEIEQNVVKAKVAKK